MTYPPEGCTYEVTYRLGRRGQGVETFAEEYKLGAWFLEMTERGAWDPAEFVEPDFDFENGYRIICVGEDGQRIAISYWHPRLVMGRINGRRRETASSNGAH